MCGERERERERERDHHDTPRLGHQGGGELEAHETGRGEAWPQGSTAEEEVEDLVQWTRELDEQELMTT